MEPSAIAEYEDGKASGGGFDIRVSRAESGWEGELFSGADIVHLQCPCDPESGPSKRGKWWIAVSPRLHLQVGESRSLDGGFDQAYLGFVAWQRRGVFRTGFLSLPLGLESPDPWNNAAFVQSGFGASRPATRLFGVGAELAADSGWRLRVSFGARSPEQWLKWQRDPGDGGATPPTFALFDDPMVGVLALTTSYVAPAWDFRAGLLWETEDLVALRATSQWFPLDALSIGLDSEVAVATTSEAEAATSPCSGGALLQMELLPRARLRPYLRAEIEVPRGSETGEPSWGYGGGLAFVGPIIQGPSQFRIAFHVEHRDAPVVETLGALDFGMWFGAPLTRDLRNVEPESLGVLSNPRRLFGAQP